MQTGASTSRRYKALAPEIRKVHMFYFGVDYPWWYSVTQTKKESLCRHLILSSDGVGSKGFAQITFRWWKEKLEREGITEIKSIPNHAKAQAFINKYEYDRTICKKLFEMYQRYNGGALVSQELKQAKSCKWEDGYRVCKRKDVCVWATPKGCKQYRNACDINYTYSLEIFKSGQKYNPGVTKEIYAFAFW